MDIVVYLVTLVVEFQDIVGLGLVVTQASLDTVDQVLVDIPVQEFLAIQELVDTLAVASQVILVYLVIQDQE